MSDLERELRAVLDDRAGQVDSDLTGPELRRRAAERAGAGPRRVRRAAPVLASAAAVVALGIGAALLTAPSDDARPVQPGGPPPATSAPATPSATPSAPATSSAASPATPQLAPAQPSVPLGRLLPSGTAVPGRSGSVPLQSLIIGPSSPSAPSRTRVSDAGRSSAPRPSVSIPSAPSTR